MFLLNPKYVLVLARKKLDKLKQMKGTSLYHGLPASSMLSTYIQKEREVKVCVQVDEKFTPSWNFKKRLSIELRVKFPQEIYSNQKGLDAENTNLPAIPQFK